MGEYKHSEALRHRKAWRKACGEFSGAPEAQVSDVVPIGFHYVFFYPRRDKCRIAVEGIRLRMSL